MLTAPPPTDKIPVLVSYHYMRTWTDEAIANVLDNPHFELLLDSGAFSALNAGAEVDLDEYIAFLNQWQDKLFGYMLLDKLGDPAQTAVNYQIMLDAGLHPIPIHVRGDDQERMDYLFERSAYVAMGGFRRPKRGWSGKGYVALKMQWAAGRPVHWLGYTRQDMLPIFRPYSCDSANLMAAAMYGLCMVFDRGRIYQYKLADILNMQEPPMRLTRALDGVGGLWSELKNPRAWRCKKTEGQRPIEMIPHAIAVRSYVQYARWAIQQFGTRVFMATTNVYDTMDLLAKYANETNTAGREPFPLAECVQGPIRTVQQWSRNV